MLSTMWNSFRESLPKLKGRCCVHITDGTRVLSVKSCTKVALGTYTNDRRRETRNVCSSTENTDIRHPRDFRTIIVHQWKDLKNRHHSPNDAQLKSHSPKVINSRRRHMRHRNLFSVHTRLNSRWIISKKSLHSTITHHHSAKETQKHGKDAEIKGSRDGGSTNEYDCLSGRQFVEHQKARSLLKETQKRTSPIVEHQRFPTLFRRKNHCFLVLCRLGNSLLSSLWTRRTRFDKKRNRKLLPFPLWSFVLAMEFFGPWLHACCVVTNKSW